jgi:hypothetical protein
MHMIDNLGVRHSHCHGVDAEEWFKIIRQVIIMLSSPDQRKYQGLAKLGPIGDQRCEDPDCRRLNRRSREEQSAFARYKIVRTMMPVQPIDHSNLRERMLCEGHPYEVGGYLCENCARVAMAKRVIDARQIRQ